MQVLDKEDAADGDLRSSAPNEFLRLAGYHGYPSNNSSGFCHHRVESFPGWHRAYLLDMEKSLQRSDKELGNDGKIYSAPCRSTHVCVFDPMTRATSFFPGPTEATSGRIPGEPVKCLWYQGACAPVDRGGAIYAAPHHARKVLRIDTATHRVDAFPISRFDANRAAKLSRGDGKWAGAVFSPVDGCIYAVPAYMGRVLRITPGKRSGGDSE